jgi:hypothetical protein
MPQQQMQQPMPQQMAQSPMPQGPEDVGIASQATAPMSMAGGGIIAFESGGDVDTDEDYQEAMDDARESAISDKMYEMIAGLKSRSDDTENRGVGITAGRRGAERGMEDKGDLESRLRSIIMQKESGGKRYDKNGNLLTSSNFYEETNSSYDFSAHIKAGISYNFKDVWKSIENLKDVDPKNALIK